MQVGELATLSSQAIGEGKRLRDSTFEYQYVVVGSVEPFIVVSTSADMLWEKFSPEDFDFICLVNPDIVEKVKERVKKHLQKDPILADAVSRLKGWIELHGDTRTKQFIEDLECVLDNVVKLQKFKTYVHTRLDDMGVPENPEPSVVEETGCRIGARLDFIDGTYVQSDESDDE